MTYSRDCRFNKITYVEHEDHYEGIMPSGESFLFDKDLYEFVSSNFWHKLTKNPKNPYITSTQNGLFHRYIMKEQLSNNLQVDHINRNQLDNRRSNLRVVTMQENLNNQGEYKTNKSGYVGVKWNKTAGKWEVQITRNKIRKYLGVFDSLEDAIQARQSAE